MRPVLPARIGRLTRLAATGALAASVAFVALPSSVLGAEPAPNPPYAKSCPEICGATCTKHRPHQLKKRAQKPTQKSSQRLPSLSDDVRLRMETYTGNNYSE
jgi:hypothetical protein